MFLACIRDEKALFDLSGAIAWPCKQENCIKYVGCHLILEIGFFVMLGLTVLASKYWLDMTMSILVGAAISAASQRILIVSSYCLLDAISNMTTLFYILWHERYPFIFFLG